MKKRKLLQRMDNVHEHLNIVADGRHEIGNLCIAISQLSEVLHAIVKTLPDDDIDEAEAMFRQHQQMKEAIGGNIPFDGSPIAYETEDNISQAELGLQGF